MNPTCIHIHVTSCFLAAPLILSYPILHAQVTRGMFMHMKQELVDETISEAGSDEEEVRLAAQDSLSHCY